MLDCGVPLVLPCMGVTSHLQTTVPEIDRHVAPHGELGAFLASRFKEMRADHFAWSRVLWDVATIAWLLDPAWVPTELVPSPVVTDQVTRSVEFFSFASAFDVNTHLHQRFPPNSPVGRLQVLEMGVPPRCIQLRQDRFLVAETLRQKMPVSSSSASWLSHSRSGWPFRSASTRPYDLTRRSIISCVALPSPSSSPPVPGSHLYGREPDPDLDQDAGWIPGEAPAGSIIVLDGRVWHSTGENRTEQPRIGLTTNFCAWQFRQQENLVLGVSDEVLATASTELLDLIGFQPGSGSGSGYGGIEGRERLRRGEYALGELKPESPDPRHGG